ncbi:MAG: hypothetical protein ACOYJX_06165 [Acutalibacteraceae bacterium]|jgi:hypothetical protein
MNITISVAEELYKLGFTYRHYQKNFHKGMVFYYNEIEWVLGGDLEEDITEFDKEIIEKGTWLPSEIHLIEWLQDNGFAIAIINIDGFWELQCKDLETCTKYYTKVPTLDFALAVVIKKILKKKERPFDTKDKIFGIIEK